MSENPAREGAAFSVEQSSSASTSAAAVAGVSARVLSCPAVLSVPARSLLVVVPNSLADVLFCLPALAALRESFPGAHLACVARASRAPVVCASGLADEVLERPRGGLSTQAGLMLKLHSQKPDVAVTFSPTHNAVLLAWSSGAPVRAGFEEARMEALLTHTISRNGPPRIEAFLELARSLGCKTPHLDYCGLLDPGPHANAQAQALLEEAGAPDRFVLVAPASHDEGAAPGWEEGSENWRAAVRELSTSWPIVVLGGSESWGGALGGGFPVLHLREPEDILVAAALCAKATLFVGADGGLLHLASAMHAPTVGVYNKDEAQRTEPRGPRRIVESGASPLQVLAEARDLIGL